MSANMGHFEVVRSDDGWFTRFIAPNGREVWRTSETYQRRKPAVNAISSILRCCYGWVEGDAVVCLTSRDGWNKRNRPTAEVRQLDERTAR